MINGDSQDAGWIMMQLMERGSIRANFPALKEPKRWSENAVEFLSETQTLTPNLLLQVS